jgi:hypothetical protein
MAYGFGVSALVSGLDAWATAIGRLKPLAKAGWLFGREPLVDLSGST